MVKKWSTFRGTIWIIMFLIAVNIFHFIPKEELQSKIQDVQSAVVYIEVTSDGYMGDWSGSGVIVHKRGLVLTAKHIVKGASEIIVELSNGQAYVAVNWTVDPDNDCAIIQLATLKDLPCIKLSTDKVVVGDSVFIIGAPFELKQTVNLGIVSAIEREDDYFGECDMTQLDIAGNPGSSGCPVFNMSKQVVGILVGGIMYADGTIFVVPAEICQQLLDEVLK